MITEILGLAGSGVAGSIFGIFSDFLQNRAESKRLESELKVRQEARLNGHTFEHLKENIAKPQFAISFFVVVSTYCLCTILCFIFPEVIVYTFNPEDEPRKFSFLFGLLSWEHKTNFVYTLSTGGLGYSLLHPLAFMIGTVITGINPSRR